jgi:hypothetical protein
MANRKAELEDHMATPEGTYTELGVKETNLAQAPKSLQNKNRSTGCSPHGPEPYASREIAERISRAKRCREWTLKMPCPSPRRSSTTFTS